MQDPKSEPLNLTKYVNVVFYKRYFISCCLPFTKQHLKCLSFRPYSATESLLMRETHLIQGICDAVSKNPAFARDVTNDFFVGRRHRSQQCRLRRR